ncbi:MAG: MFS transporter [Nostocoides sp.]
MPPLTTLAPLPRLFRVFWAGETVSLLGSSTSAVFVPLVAVVSLHATATWMGIITACTWLPWLVVGLPAGAWVDRLQPRRVMMTADLVAAAASVSVPVAWLLGRLSLAQLVLVAFVSGTASVFFRAAYPRLVRAVAADSDPATAYGRLNGTESFMQVAGPGLAGLLLTVVHAAVGLFLDAVSFLVSAFCLRRMPPVPAATDTPPPLRSRIAEGWRTLVHDPMLRFGTALGGASNFGLTGYQTLLVLFLVRTVGLSSSRVGLLLALGAVGGVAGAAIAPRLSRSLGSARSLRLLQLLAAPTALLVPAAGLAQGVLARALVVAGLFGVGLGVVGGNVVRSAFNQGYIPDEIRARLVTSSAVVNYGTMPVAALAAGWLGTAYGLVVAMTVMAGIHAIACLAVLVGPYRSGRDLPTGQLTVR